MKLLIILAAAAATIVATILFLMPSAPQAPATATTPGTEQEVQLSPEVVAFRKEAVTELQNIGPKYKAEFQKAATQDDRQLVMEKMRAEQQILTQAANTTQMPNTKGLANDVARRQTNIEMNFINEKYHRLIMTAKSPEERQALMAKMREEMNALNQSRNPR